MLQAKSKEGTFQRWIRYLEEGYRGLKYVTHAMIKNTHVCLQEVEFGCGRVMSDVSSMFIVYLLELQTWHRNISVTSAVLRDLWPHAKRAAEWQMNISSTDGIPRNLVDTYDVLGLCAYRHSTYSSAFHLLAMKAAEKLAYEMGKLP